MVCLNMFSFWRIILGCLLPIIVGGYLMLFSIMELYFYHAAPLSNVSYTELFFFTAIAIMPCLFAVYYLLFMQSILYAVVLELLNLTIRPSSLFVLISTLYGGASGGIPFYVLPKINNSLDIVVHFFLVGIGTGFFIGLILRRSCLKTTKSNKNIGLKCEKLA